MTIRSNFFSMECRLISSSRNKEITEITHAILYIYRKYNIQIQ